MKYKIGDKVVVKEGNIEYIRPVAGRVGIILAYNSYTDNYLVEFDDGLKIWCDIKGYAPNKQKIVITTDGKITTAKLFENRQLIKAVEAKCHPEDTFDFNVGAKLAFDRLIGTPMGKQKPVEVDGFKVGDRVHVDGHNGTIICIAYGFEPNIGVEFDDGYGCHNCEGFELRDGNYGTKHSSSWRSARELTHGEVPKYYNGKVVCVKNATAGFTIGKIYNIVDGVLLDDDGSQRPFPGMDYRIKSADEVYITHKFIPLVED